MTPPADRREPSAADFERDVVEAYTHDLLRLARRGLPRLLQARVDPDDIVQSVYRSFFRRLNEGQFRFSGPDDVWRLLARMTFRKACNACQFHQCQRRDARREQPIGEDEAGHDRLMVTVQSDDVDFLWQSLESILTGLPERYRDILVLRLGGESITGIARQLDCSERTVHRVLAGITASATQLMEQSS